MSLEISGKTGAVSVGEKISLGVKYTVDCGVLKSVEWEIPGKTVKEYKADFVEGKVIEIKDDDKKRFTINFYWVDGADGRTVNAKCVFTSSGKDMNKTISATFDVKRPKMKSYSSKTGSVKIESDKFGLLGPGITWIAKVEPNSAATGEIAFIQRINPHRVWTPGKKWTSSGNFVLDGAPGKTEIFYAQKRIPLSGGEAKLESNDSPSNPLSSFPTALETTGKDKFEIYLMYRPSGVDSIWVPLGVLLWDWEGVAKRATVTNPWVVQASTPPSADPSGNDTLEFPLWDKYYPNLGYT